MKLFSLESQILALSVSTVSAIKYNNAADGINQVFGTIPNSVWSGIYVQEAVKAKYPKSWKRWIKRKSRQLAKLGGPAQRAFDRCGTEAR